MRSARHTQAAIQAGLRDARRRPARSPSRAVRLSVEGLESRALLSVFDVTNLGDIGPGSLRQAMRDANDHVGADTIQFHIGTGLQTIQPSSGPLPTITEAVTIDASTQPGYAGRPIIELNGALAGSSSNGLSIAASGCVVSGLVINQFGNYGVLISGPGASGNRIQGNYIGLTSDGKGGKGNGNDGVRIDNAPGNIIGGTTDPERNVISANNVAPLFASGGVKISGASATGNRVVGNYIGTDAPGTKPLGNGNDGVDIDGGASGNTIGGTSSASANVISASKYAGVSIFSSPGNLIAGNKIGTDWTGTQAIANGSGITLQGPGGAPRTTIGGIAAGAGNVISGNTAEGISVFGGDGILIQGNLIGMALGGKAALPNGTSGVYVQDSPRATIGGAVAGAGNVISANLGNGLFVIGGSINCSITSNFIGTTTEGKPGFGNRLDGVVLNSGVTGATIGGTTDLARNVISGNIQRGVLILGANAGGNLIRGNFIGTDVAGTVDLGNGWQGIEIIDSPGNTIGGTIDGARNIISGNDNRGILIQGINATGNLIHGNYIGIDVAGTTDLGNAWQGVEIWSPRNTVGGPTATDRNIISGNDNRGVLILGVGA